MPHVGKPSRVLAAAAAAFLKVGSRPSPGVPAPSSPGRKVPGPKRLAIGALLLTIHGFLPFERLAAGTAEDPTAARHSCVVVRRLMDFLEKKKTAKASADLF